MPAVGRRAGHSTWQAAAFARESQILIGTARYSFRTTADQRRATHMYTHAAARAMTSARPKAVFACTDKTTQAARATSTAATLGRTRLRTAATKRGTTRYAGVDPPSEGTCESALGGWQQNRDRVSWAPHGSRTRP